MKLSDVRLSPERVLKDISEIAEFHRIQGSRELVESVEMIKEKLDELGVENKLLRSAYDGETWHGTLASPIAWNPVRGELSYGERKLTTEESPLLIMAHSPEGEAKAELLPVFRDEDWGKAEGKIVLAGRDWRDAYKRANEAGAKAFIAYREGTGEFYPYIGLFLTRDDLEWAKIPALAVPESVAKDMISKSLKGGVEVGVSVQVETPEREDLPMLYATVGEAPYIVFSAHICHPKPGANDNASGSAMLIELARKLSEAYRDSFRFGFAFLWIPEYHGTQAFFERVKPEEFYANVNLDMVAGSPDRSGSTLMLVRTPFSRFSVVSGLLEHFIGLTNRKGKSFSGSELPAMAFKAYPYEMGSDHDIFNFFNIPGTMPITWPDRVYHSSGDTVEKVSLETIAIIGNAVLATALTLAGEDKEKLRRFARGYAMKVLGEVSMNTETEESEKLVMRGLARDSRFLDFELGYEFESEPWLEWKLRGILNERLIRRNGGNAEEFKRLTEDRKVYAQLHELLMLSELLPRGGAFKALEEEYGKVDKEKLERLVGVLEEAKIVTLS
ncbi:DUF4910 domain-containing protein [Thermococcus sp. 21S9]|uniref:DUF4910 domain-containing protein n=1 Tax=Thermococcus sp. 21S9 TaxID=1638223 RepID=UPI0014395AE0|nr:DUF4910 domain-containing protein [Thermococcus sp. 21S9]NJE54677.1 DUF4910 domain-containing protein [Thermococcus sp. 21S9]